MATAAAIAPYARLVPGAPVGVRARHGAAATAAVVRPAATPPRGRSAGRRVVVPVHFHTITAGDRGRVPRAAITRQIARLNAAYGGRFGGVDTGVSFRLAGVHRTDNAAWFRQPYLNEGPMLRAIRRGGPETLNLVTAAVGVDLLGFSTFPQWYAEAPDRDGVVIDYRSLPGGAFRQFKRGFTAVHEIGHWLGLFHTFENGCADPGDHVSDTPRQGVPTLGCPRGKDTCAEKGADPVHNFMDYSRDSCMREFTAGQAKRIRTLWAAYRAGGGTAASPPMSHRRAVR